MEKIFCLIIILYSVINLHAQNLKGIVKTKSGVPIEGATINILNTDRSVIADKEGKFTITKISAGNYQLSINSVGYASQIKEVKVTEGSTSVINIVLTEQGKQLDEVVVSSDKTETDLQQTPLAVSSLSGKKLNDYRAWNITDLTALAPSVFVVEHGNSSGSNFFNIRGTMGFSTEQSVATYVDGVYQFDFYSAPINFNNIERIEILRGPQGTLYGRNAFSGVVNIITKKPTNDTHGFAEIDLGNYGQQRYTVGVNAPIIKNKLFFDVSGQYNGRGSVYSNPTLSTKHFDGRKDFNVTGNLRYLISDKWQINVNAKTENDNDKGAYPWAASDSAARNHPYQEFGNWNNTERRSNTNVSVAVNYYGKHFNFTSITAGVDYHIWIPGRVDYDFTPLNLLSVSNATRSNELTQEFRFSSPANAGRLKWTGGSYLFAEKIKTNAITYYDQDYAAIDTAAPYSTITKDTLRNRGIALYGQATYSLTSKLDITAGARYDLERKEITESNDFDKDNMITPLTDTKTDGKTFHAFTPKLTLSYKLTDNSLIYASYAKGFRIGGFNVAATDDNRAYKPEKSDNYETAIKNNLFQDRLKLNLTVFYLQQKDQQVSTSTDGVNALTLNVGDMNNLGLETEIAAIPVKNFSIEWNAAWSHAKYAKLDLYDYTTSSTVNYKGNHPINNPDFSSMVAGQYNYPLSNSKQNIAAFARLEYRYIGRYYLDFVNSDSQSGYGLINARAGITAKNFEIAVWGRNINDARYIAYGYGAYILGSPKMWGITLTGKF
ncbi:MAG: TonB-dependent receptor [Arachidicoccus sp.]|nr:TonB-dependent receptor [Arachidicoccus sp.]